MERGFNERFKAVIEDLKGSDIYGCITGSCMLPDADFDTWMDKPDIDVFVYSDTALVQAMMILESWGFTPGGKGKTEAGEKLKREWIIETGVHRNKGLTTIMYEKDDIFINLTVKEDFDSVIAILASFDMSIIMIGYDIPSHYLLDLRTQDGNDPKVATPNKMKRQLYNHPSRFTVWRAVHQWDRVPKYYSRGYDTRPMARFYLEKIDAVLEAGAAFNTERDIESFNEMEPGFLEVRQTITDWLEEHEED